MKVVSGADNCGHSRPVRGGYKFPSVELPDGRVSDPMKREKTVLLCQSGRCRVCHLIPSHDTPKESNYNAPFSASQRENTWVRYYSSIKERVWRSDDKASTHRWEEEDEANCGFLALETVRLHQIGKKKKRKLIRHRKTIQGYSHVEVLSSSRHTAHTRGCGFGSPNSCATRALSTPLLMLNLSE